MCKKLKLPVKAFQALILIMVIFQQCSSSAPRSCFGDLGPVWKTRVYNDDNGYVYVSKANKHIFTDRTGVEDTYLYKISTDDAFYLFDPNTKRFLCWKNINGTMTTMNYENINRRNHWNLCKFVDPVARDKRYTNAYVHLELKGHPGSTMQFDKKGRNVSHKRRQKCLKNKNYGGRHSHKRCAVKNIFILYGDNIEDDCCSEAHRALCRGKTAMMPELKGMCRPARQLCRA